MKEYFKAIKESALDPDNRTAGTIISIAAIVMLTLFLGVRNIINVLSPSQCAEYHSWVDFLFVLVGAVIFFILFIVGPPLAVIVLYPVGAVFVKIADKLFTKMFESKWFNSLSLPQWTSSLARRVNTVYRKVRPRKTAEQLLHKAQNPSWVSRNSGAILVGIAALLVIIIIIIITVEIVKFYYCI